MQPSIRALMVATSFPADLGDWRGLFIRHMADALGRRPDIDLRLWAPPGDVDPSVRFDLTRGDRTWLAKLMHDGGIAHAFRSDSMRGKLAALSLLTRLWRAYRRNPDCALFHINWLQCALAVPNDRRPLLVSALGSDLQLLRLPLVRRALRTRFKHRRVAICPNADWMVPPLQAAFGDLAEVRFVPFGIDPAWYALGRSPIRPARWIAVTRLTSAKLGPLFEWAAPHFSDGQRELHLLGPMQESVDLPAWVRHHGPASPAQLRDTWFPSATGLVTLSRHAEGRPQVMLEAMAAGLPVLASDIPAHASFVGHGSTGWLCGSKEALAEGLVQVEQPERNHRLGAAARDWARGEVGTWDDCAARYVAIYRRLLGHDASVAGP